MAVMESKFLITDEDNHSSLALIESLEHARRMEESRRATAEAQLLEYQASMPQLVQAAVRVAADSASANTLLFERMKKEYEMQIDELRDANELLKSESLKRQHDAKEVHEEMTLQADTIHDELAVMRRAHQLVTMQMEKLRNDLLSHKLKSLNDIQLLNRALSTANEVIATRREEAVVEAEAEKPLLLAIQRLNEAQASSLADFRTAKRRAEVLSAERVELVEENAKVYKMSQQYFADSKRGR